MWTVTRNRTNTARHRKTYSGISGDMFSEWWTFVKNNSKYNPGETRSSILGHQYGWGMGEQIVDVKWHHSFQLKIHNFPAWICYTLNNGQTWLTYIPFTCTCISPLWTVARVRTCISMSITSHLLEQRQKCENKNGFQIRAYRLQHHMLEKCNTV